MTENHESLADRIRSIANAADRPGDFRLLNAIADELEPENPDDTYVYDYAVRYCMTRPASYAYADGFDLANTHWDKLTNATRDDVIKAARAHGFPTADPYHWPIIWGVLQGHPSVRDDET